MATGFIDFMAFARGEEAASQANWRDRINQQGLDERQQEQAWRETERALALPVAQARQQATLAELQDATLQRDVGQRVAQRTSDILREAAQYGDEAGGMMAVRTYEALQQARTPQERQALQAFGTNQALQLYQAGRTQEATGLLSAIGRPDIAQRAEGAAQWNDPNFFTNPQNIEQAGGRINADGTVTYQPNANAPAFTMPLTQFVQLQRQRAFDATRDTAGVLGQAAQAGQARATWQQYMDDLNAAGYPNNIQYRGNPLTQQITALPIPPVQPVYPSEGARGSAAGMTPPTPQLLPTYPGATAAQPSAPMGVPQITVPAAATPGFAPPVSQGQPAAATPIITPGAALDAARSQTQQILQALQAMGGAQRLSNPGAFAALQQQLQQAQQQEAAAGQEWEQYLRQTQPELFQPAPWLTRPGVR